MNAAKVSHTKIVEQMKMAAANEKGMATAKIQIRCECTHRDQDGSIDLSAPKPDGPKGKFTGNKLYRCRSCGNYIDLSPVPQEKFDEALDTMNRIIDVSKMRYDFKNEKDMKLLEAVRQFQYTLNVLMPDVYNSVVKNGGKKNKNKNKNSSFSMYRVN